MAVIKTRLDEYHSKTEPVKKFYEERELLHNIDGVGTIKEIHQRISSVINARLKNEWMNIVVAGAPGSGKGTQGRMLAKKYNLYYISTGSKLRKEVANETEFGKQVKPYLDKGELVPDEIVIQLIEREIKRHNNVNGFVFKGFPRTIVQAYILDGLLRKVNSAVTVCMELQLPTLDSVKRLSARGKTEKGRSYDKSTDLIVRRLEEYQNRTEPVIDYYQKMDKVLKINAKGEREEVFERLSQSVENTFKNVR
jgi:adenylate kinase